ncbi:hypothetical protein X777_04726 [Ooceraea biroi]|uniref:Uncharacterized protein n=1 Tax=Ooceraea biroi TaxID=2015173 RepID=A0A026X0T1_OOCBI|nr:hypothetical protein X777_04726 [Ooceraea biroi]
MTLKRHVYISISCSITYVLHDNSITRKSGSMTAAPRPCRLRPLASGKTPQNLLTAADSGVSALTWSKPGGYSPPTNKTVASSSAPTIREKSDGRSSSTAEG